MDEPLIETEPADSEPQRRSGPWRLIAVVALLTLIGVWLVPDETTDPAPPVVEQPEARSEAPSLLQRDTPAIGEADGGPSGDQRPAAVAGGDPSVELPSTAAGTLAGPPGTRARAMISEMRRAGDDDLDAVFGAAIKAQSDGELADAYLLYFYAAREGHAPSALVLGRHADPATRDPENSLFASDDLTQAHKWYQVAARGGDPEAGEHLADLRERIERLAAEGDVQARRIALLWQ